MRECHFGEWELLERQRVSSDLVLSPEAFTEYQDHERKPDEREVSSEYIPYSS